MSPAAYNGAFYSSSQPVSYPLLVAVRNSWDVLHNRVLSHLYRTRNIRWVNSQQAIYSYGNALTSAVNTYAYTNLNGQMYSSTTSVFPAQSVITPASDGTNITLGIVAKIKNALGGSTS